MTNDATPIRAPQGAIAWTAADGWLFDAELAPSALDTGEPVLVVSADGFVRGVTPHDRAPLAAVLRLDGDLAEVVQRLGDLGDTLWRRVTALEDRASGLDTGLAVEVAAIKGRLRKLEGRRP